MEEEKILVLDQGVEAAEVAANPACCKIGQARLQTAPADEE